jgi:hypothetical protein
VRFPPCVSTLLTPKTALLGLSVGFLASPGPGDGHLLEEPAPAVIIAPGTVPGVEAHGCRECHPDVTHEWAASAHGLAWVDEDYQDTISQRKRPELCHGCHVPRPVLHGDPDDRPRARDEVRVHGVDCASCHEAADGAQLGPHGRTVDAHPSRASEHMSAPGSNALCSACHDTNVGPVLGIAKDFAAAGMAERGLSCVGCHMAPVTRAWATGADEREGRSHALQTPRDPAFLRLAFGLERVDGPPAKVIVRNQAGHRVPGLVGREIELRADLLDASGAVLESVTHRIDARAHLPVDGELELVFTKALPADARIRVAGLHHDPRSLEPIPFLDAMLAGSGD